MAQHFKLYVTAASMALLSACGGGGGGGSSASNAVIEGVWSGTSSNGYTLNALSLENGSTYVMFGTVTANVLAVYGFDQGTVAVNGSTVSGSINEYLFNGTTATGTMKGTAVTGTSISGTTTANGSSVTYSLAPISASTYSYTAAPSLNDIAGNWSGSMLNGNAALVAITGATGAIAGSSAGCFFNGTAAPRASGKNVFNVSITFGAAPCALPGQTVTGIAIDYAITGTALRQLLVAVQDASGANGTMFIASR